MSKNYSYLTRKESFCIAHKLYNNKLSHEENLRIYDKCTNCHGHNYNLFVTIKAPIDPITGMVMNFNELKEIIRVNVYDKLDHKYLNDDVEEFKELLPTAENSAIVIWNWLKPLLPDIYEVRLEETESNSVIYRGE